MIVRKLKNKTIEFLHEVTGIMNLSLTQSTSKNEVVSFIKKLYPIEFELIRLGSSKDGGYLVPNDLEGIEACFSPGVETVSEFEKDCLSRGMKIFLADFSVDKPNFDLLEGQFDFSKLYVGSTNNQMFITMDDWVKNKIESKNSDLLLQMDIEGGEIDTIIRMSDELLKRFRIMVIEFHNLQNLWNKHYFKYTKIVFDKILQTHHCVHIHPNNVNGVVNRRGVKIPPYAEFTFIRKDRVEQINYVTNFPHYLDFDNTKNDSLILPRNWYSE